MIIILFVALGIIYETLGQTHFQTRLLGPNGVNQGPTGVVEVLHAGVWGRICDDGFDIHPANCLIICKSLSYAYGVPVPAASSGVYTSLPGSNQIWLDDVKCTGFETNVGECQRGVSLQQHHCNYDETAVCACHHTSSLPPTFTPGSSTAPPGTCTSHQLGFYDATNNDVGIAKICTSPGQCSYICDDFWEQVDAQVFCSCLGYTDRTQMHAIGSTAVSQMYVQSNPLPINYGSFGCTTADIGAGGVDNCPFVRNPNCPGVNVAIVACRGLPGVTGLTPPLAVASCDGANLTVCFQSSTSNLDQNMLKIRNCQSATTYAQGSKKICASLNIQACMNAAVTMATQAQLRYCFSADYAQTGSGGPHQLQTHYSWSRTVCCSIKRTGSVTMSFQPVTMPQPPVYVATEVTFTLQCYNSGSFTGGSSPNPVYRRGETASCAIQSSNPELLLVVTTCVISPDGVAANGLLIMDNRCTTTNGNLLNLQRVPFNSTRWGFTFDMPVFSTSSEVHVACDAIACDVATDGMTVCDRSCPSTAGRKRRSIDLGDLRSILEHRDASEVDAVVPARTPLARRKRQSHIQHGSVSATLGVIDTGYGPYISNGKITIVPKPPNVSPVMIEAPPPPLPPVLQQRSPASRVTVECFRSPELRGLPQVFNRGDLVQCLIESSDPLKLLVVEDCYLSPNRRNRPHLVLTRDRCPSTREALHFTKFDLGELTSWGFTFNLPLFPGYMRMRVMCDVTTCSGMDLSCSRQCIATHHRVRRDSTAEHQRVETDFSVRDTGVGPMVVNGEIVNEDYPLEDAKVTTDWGDYDFETRVHDADKGQASTRAASPSTTTTTTSQPVSNHNPMRIGDAHKSAEDVRRLLEEQNEVLRRQMAHQQELLKQQQQQQQQQQQMEKEDNSSAITFDPDVDSMPPAPTFPPITQRKTTVRVSTTNVVSGDDDVIANSTTRSANASDVADEEEIGVGTEIDPELLRRKQHVERLKAMADREQQRRLENGQDVWELEKTKYEQKQFELKRDRQRAQFENAASSPNTSAVTLLLSITVVLIVASS